MSAPLDDQAVAPLPPGRESETTSAAAELRAAFRQFDQRSRAPLRQWAERALTGRDQVKTLFYPFGGPDFCVPSDLFPRAQTYVLVGREPALVPSGAADPVDLSAALKHYLDHAYFITERLGRHLHGREHDGITPLLLAQITHSGGTPVSVSAIEGGIEIVFRTAARTQRIVYFAQDLRDEYVDTTAPLFRLLSESRFATLLKCASYLPHEPNFETLRHVIRSRASLLVQDPSGVPFATLNDWDWQIDLHGRYRGDIGVFSRYDQSALAAASEAANGSPLGFGFGYLTDPQRATLIVARPPQDSRGAE